MVYPSGFAVATKVGPTVPDPPARFTIRSGWPRILAAASASTRVDRSVLPPAPQFTLTSISRSGTACAPAAPSTVPQAAAHREPTRDASMSFFFLPSLVLDP